MAENNILELIEKEVKTEAQRVYKILFDLYNKNITVNKPFYKLVDKYIDPKYKIYNTEICLLIVKMIPLELQISPNNKKVFVTTAEFKKIEDIESQKKIESMNNLLNQTVNKVADKIVISYRNKSEVNLFDIINECIKKSEFEQIDSNIEKKYIFNSVYYKLKENGLTIIGINPIKLKKCN